MSRAPEDYDLYSLIENIHPTWFRHLHWFDEAAERGAPMPASWKALSKKSLPEIIDGLWGGENGHFPQYVAYLKEHLVCLFVGEDQKRLKDGKYTIDDQPGIYLIYFIRDEEIHSWKFYQHEFYIAGGPTPEADIEAFDQTYGRLPEDAKALLRLHHFMYLTNNDLLAPIPHAGQLLDSSADYLGIKTARVDGVTQYECFAWIGGMEIPTCLVRKPGATDWESELMDAYRWEDLCDDHYRITLDALLVRNW